MLYYFHVLSKKLNVNKNNTNRTKSENTKLNEYIKIIEDTEIDISVRNNQVEYDYAWFGEGTDRKEDNNIVIILPP